VVGESKRLLKIPTIEKHVERTQEPTENAPNSQNQNNKIK
jgi:hypothetical protein